MRVDPPHYILLPLFLLALIVVVVGLLIIIFFKFEKLSKSRLKDIVALSSRLLLINKMFMLELLLHACFELEGAQTAD